MVIPNCTFPPVVVLPAAIIFKQLLPSKVSVDSPLSVLAVPLPVITLLSALLFIVVPLIVLKLKVPEPFVVST